MRSIRAAIPAAAGAARSAKVCERVLTLPEVLAARRVALFWPLVARAEVDLRAVDTALRQRSVVLYYPFQRESADPPLGFAPLHEVSRMGEHGHGFLEPPPDEPGAIRGELDVIVVPALAVSATGHRLGYGRGYYDRALRLYRPPACAVVVAFDFQLLAELPSTNEDVACDIVVTDERTLRVSPGAIAP